jgi:DNA-binding transcriptional ArsR family regulator
MTKITAEPLLMITDLETLKVVSDPLRLKIFQTVSEYNHDGTLCSVKQIADALDIPQTKLYYHIKQLESQDLLLVGETRIVSGIVEKLYQVSAYKIMVANDLFLSDAGKQAIFPLYSEMINHVTAEIQSLLEKPDEKEDEKGIAISRHSLRLPLDKVQRYSQKIETLLQEIETEVEHLPRENTRPYTFFSVFYPETS